MDKTLKPTRTMRPTAARTYASTVKRERYSCYFCRQVGDEADGASWYSPQMRLEEGHRHVYTCSECHRDFLRNGYAIDWCRACLAATYVSVESKTCLDCQMALEPVPPPPKRRRRRRGGRRRKRLSPMHLYPCPHCADPTIGLDPSLPCAACAEVARVANGESWNSSSSEEELSAMD